MNMKILKILIPWLLICLLFVFVLACVWSVRGSLCLLYNGFAVDGEQNIYIGKSKRIEVFDLAGNSLRSIDAHTDRGYDFCIQDGDTIYLNATGRLFVLDTEGNVLQEPVEYESLEYSERPRFTPRKCTTPDGKTYLLRNHFLRPTVYLKTPDGRVPLYQMPLTDYILRLGLIFIWCGTWIVVLLCLWLDRRSGIERHDLLTELGFNRK